MEKNKRPSEILGINDEDIQKHLHSNPEKAEQVAKTLMELDKSKSNSSEFYEGMDIFNQHRSSHGIPVFDKPIKYYGILKTPIVLGFLALFLFLIILEVIVVIITGHF